MSIYREESVEALTEALQKKAFPASKLKDFDAFLCLSRHLTNSGNSILEARLLNIAGFNHRYDATMREERQNSCENDITNSMALQPRFSLPFNFLQKSIASTSRCSPILLSSVHESSPVDDEILRHQIRDERAEMEQRLQEKIEERMTQWVLTILTNLQRANPELKVDQNMIAALPDEDSSAPRAKNQPIFGGSFFGRKSEGGFFRT